MTTKIKPQQYVVGGSPRDILMGNVPKDIDYVWTGTTPEDMLSRGMTKVGANFPVFLDSKGQEHALARIEKKVDKGYNGFECDFHPDITIEDDLARRDLTINALAVKMEDWERFVQTRDTSLVIDPFGGIHDIRQQVIIHINEHFGLDPIRVLRTARFSARYEFAVNIKTLDLMSHIAHELDYVPTERIWQEIYKGLQERHPVHMFNVLSMAEVFDVDIMKPYKQYNREALKRYTGDSILVKFCLSAVGFSHEDYNKMSIPNEYARVSHAYNQRRYNIEAYASMSTSQRLDLLYNLRAFNNTDLVEDVLNVLIACVPTYGQCIKEQIFGDINQLKTIDVRTVIEQCKSGEEIKQKLYDVRLDELNKYI